MSRTKPTGGGTTSPIKYRFSFGGASGKIKYYDKEKSEDVEMDSLDFIILDKRSSITGWNEADGSSIYSNLVVSTKKEELVVKTSKRTLASGLYEDIKGKMDNFGGKFTTNLLCLAKIGKNWEMANIQLTGSALGVWMDTESGKVNIYDQIFTITEGEKRKKGAVKFIVPEFSYKKITSDLIEMAEESDEILQAYFDSYTPADSKKSETETESKPEKRQEAKANTGKAAKSKKAEEEAEEEDDSDLPF